MVARIRENIVTFRDALMREELPIGIVQDAIVQFMRDRDDAALFGAQAVNVYVSPQRTTEDVDIATLAAPELAEELRKFLNEKFYIAARVRSVRGGIGYRVYQVRKPENRHLADIRPVTELPPTQTVDGVRVVQPAELIANKVASSHARGQKEKGLTDRRDLMGLLRTFPELKVLDGEVQLRLKANDVDEAILASWHEWVATDLPVEDEDDEFDW